MLESEVGLVLIIGPDLGTRAEVAPKALDWSVAVGAGMADVDGGFTRDIIRDGRAFAFSLSIWTAGPVTRVTRRV